MRVILVEDEELALVELEKAVKKAVPSDATLLSYSNPVEALKANKGEKVDIAFLDVKMPEMDGVELAKTLKKANPLINIIFVTTYDDYALDAHKMHASGYIDKPVSSERINEEYKVLRYPILKDEKKLMQVKCFGNFEVFVNDEPLKFQRSKSKELFAYLVDREGATANINELNAVLWEEDHKSYLRNLIVDIQQTLSKAGVGEVFIKRHNECSIRPEKLDCDAYEYKKNNPKAVKAYRGEYMIQYEWAYFTKLYD